MLRALDIYRRLIAIHIRSQLQYRASFLLDVLATGMTSAIGILTLSLVLQRFHDVGGWGLPELAFLYGMVETSFGVMDMVFSGFDPQQFGIRVRLGTFDQLLLRPVNVTLQVLGSDFQTRRTGRILQGLLAVLFALGLLRAHLTWLKLLYLPLMAAGMVCFFGGLFIIGATITFWTVESIEAINVFTYGGTEMASYPMHIYPDWLRRFFTYVLPAIFLNYYPALWILDKPDPFNMPAFAPFLAPAAGLLVLAAGLAFWSYGIRRYQSTGT